MTILAHAATDIAPSPSPAPRVVAAPAERSARREVVVRPWSALVCGAPSDSSLLIVDWLLLACREAGLVAQAMPIASGDAAPHGMYIEVAADERVESALGDVPWGAVDLVVAGEHLELARAIEAGFVDPSVTTVIASCRRSFTDVEHAVEPQQVLGEMEIDAIASASSAAYHAFDGPEVAAWYHLPRRAEPGLLLGAMHGCGITRLDPDCFERAIAQLGIDDELFVQAFRRGARLGRRSGGRVRRARTAYQFTRRRRALVARSSCAGFEALVERAQQVVQPEHVSMLQEAIFRLCLFQDAEWAGLLVDRVADLVEAEQAQLGAAPAPHESIAADAIRSLTSLLVWPDSAWVAQRKRRGERVRELRSAHGISRRDAFELVEFLPVDERDRYDLRPSWRRRGARPQPPVLQPIRVERIRTTSLGGAMRLARRAATSRHRAGTERQRLELDTVEAWMEAMHDAIRCDLGLAQIVARSGSLVQGSGAVREAHRATANAFWGRIVRQSIAMDRAAAAPEPLVARRVITFVWDQLCRSGPLAMWEYAAPVLGIALAHARGASYADTVALAQSLCEPRRTAG